MRLEGFYFVLDPKNSNRDITPKSFKQKIKTPEKIFNNPITIEPNPNYGWPSVLAYKVLQAILKKASENNFAEIVHFSKRELLQLAGRESYGGSALEQLHTAIKQLSNTEIESWFYDKTKKKWGTATIRIINKEMFSGENGELQNCWLKLDDLIITSLKAHHYFCLNYERFRTLPPISSILYKRLFYHFSNIFSQKREKKFCYRKDYIELCETWVGLKSRKFKAEIERQFKAHFEYITKTKLVEQVVVEKKKDQSGFNLVFYPGPSFFEDYEKFYTQHQQPELNFQAAAEYRANVDPAQVVLFFYKSLHNVDDWQEELINQNDIEYARGLLVDHSVEEIHRFIIFAIEEAKKTNFTMKHFVAIRSYQGEFFAKLKRMKARKQKSLQQKQLQRKKAEEDKEALRKKNAYEEYFKTKAVKYKQTLSGDQIEELESQLLKEHTILSTLPNQLENMLNNKLAELSNALSFEEWLESSSEN